MPVYLAYEKCKNVFLCPADGRKFSVFELEVITEKGKLLFAAGLLNELDHIIGSNMIMEFESELELSNYLEQEPYVKDKVWNEIKVYPAKVAPFCL